MTREELRKSRALLRKFLSRYRKHLGRKEVQALVETYVTGLLSDTRKRNAEAMALEIGGGRVRALQRLLVSARWDEDAVVRERECDVAEIMGSAEGIFVVDDTGFRKKGNRSCGVGRQYSGTLGKVENCQIGVFLGYAVSGTGHTLLDRKLYLQEDWFAPEMEEIRTRAHMPDNVVFRTKHELALEMIEAARAQGVPHSWVNMDADYGKVPKFLDALDGLGERYAAQVPSSTQVWTEKPKTHIPRRKGDPRRGRAPAGMEQARGGPGARGASGNRATLRPETGDEVHTIQRPRGGLADGDRAGRSRPLDGGAVLRAGQGRPRARAVPDEDLARVVSSHYAGHGSALVSDRNGSRRGKKGRGRRRYRSSGPSSHRHLSGTGGRSRPAMIRRHTTGGATARRASLTAAALSGKCRNRLGEVTL
jgi:SRSO17 transposase